MREMTCSHGTKYGDFSAVKDTRRVPRRVGCEGTVVAALLCAFAYGDDTDPFGTFKDDAFTMRTQALPLSRA